MDNADKDQFGFGDFDEDSFDEFDMSNSGNSDSNNSLGDFNFGDTSFEDFDDSEIGNGASTSYSNLEDSLGSSGMSIDDIDTGYVDGHEDISESKKIMKTSFIAIGAGLIIIMVGFGINRVIKSNSNNAKDVVEIQREVNTEAPSLVENTTVKENSNWVQFNGDIDVSNSVEIESSFTVTSVKHYAMVTNGESDKQLKSTVIGNISGLIGTYEIDIPFEIAQSLSGGAVFKVTYKLATNNGYSVISGVKY